MTEGGRSAWQGIEVRHLAALLALAEESSFNRAARRLGYSQPAVSQQLAALERIVGRQLVNRPRASQPLSLTDAGERLLVHARAIQTNLALAEADLGTTAAAHLRIGTYQTIAAHLPASRSARALGDVARRRRRADGHAGRRAPRQLSSPGRARPRVRRPAAPLSGESSRPKHWRRTTTSSRCRAIRRAHHRPSRFASPSCSELKLIGFKSSGSTQRVITHLRNRGIELQFALRSDDNSMIQGFVAAGFGAALIPGLCRRPSFPRSRGAELRVAAASAGHRACVGSRARGVVAGRGVRRVDSECRRSTVGRSCNHSRGRGRCTQRQNDRNLKTGDYENATARLLR